MKVKQANKILSLLLAVAMVFAMLPVLTPPAYAATTYTVTSTSDDGSEGTLRYAINQVNGGSGGDTITIDSSLAGQTITLTSGLPQITKEVAISGNGITISGDNKYNILDINNADVTLSGITFANGYGSSSTPSAIYIEAGNLNVTDCVFSGNTSFDGGTVFVFSGFSSGSNVFATTLVNCLFVGNTNRRDGGVVQASAKDSDSVTLINCTFTPDNTSVSSGNIFTSWYLGDPTIRFFNCILANADNGNGLLGGSLESNADKVIFKNTLTDYPSSSLGNNPENSGNITNASLGLYSDGTLAVGSPAIDSGDSALFPDAATSTDLAGNPRVEGVAIDIGAYEGSVIALAPVITTGDLPNAYTGQAYSQKITAEGRPNSQWSIDSGALPAGLSLSSAGIISGTPTMAGTFRFTVKAANSAGSDTKELSLTVEPSTFTVTKTADDGSEGSLRWAIEKVNTSYYGGETITVDPRLSGQTITLTSALPEITKDVLINGNGVIVSGASAYAILEIDSCDATLSRITFEKGRSNSISGAGALSGIKSNLTVTDCIFRNNSGTRTGAVYLEPAGGETAVLVNCLFADNLATIEGCGAIYYYDYNGGGGLTVINSTFRGGHDARDGSNILYYSTGTDIRADIQFLNCVIENPKNDRAMFHGFKSSGSRPTIDDVVFKNTLTDYPSLGSNAVSVDNIILPPGTSTLTQADGSLPAGSPGIDAGNSAHLPAGITMDLTGKPRIAGEAIDIGALEYGGALPAYTVTKTGDDGSEGTLRWAIEKVNESYSGGHTIEVHPDLAGETITLDSTLPNVIKGFTLDGRGIIIDGGGKQIFYIEVGNVNLNRITFTGGYASWGSALRNRSNNLTVANCVFKDNTGGSAVYLENGNASFINCLFTGNTASYGGAVLMGGRMNSAVFTNCTFTASNTALYDGNIFQSFKDDSDTALQVLNCVIANADNGISLFSGMTSGNSIDDLVFKNTLSNVSLGDNPANANNEVGASDLGLNADGTLMAGSPAIDAGDNSFNSAIADLAGNARVVNGTIDMGAYEYGINSSAPEIATTALPGGNVRTAYSQTLTAAGSVPITWTLDSGNLPAGLSLSFAGMISGQPSAVGTENFTVKATNSQGSDTKALSITIEAAGSYTVTSTADDGSGSTLRWAIGQVNAHSGGGTITVAPSIAGQTITLTADLPQIDKSFTMNGNGITISGDNQFSIFSNLRNTDVTLNRITFADGVGAIVNRNSNLTVSDCIFRGNTSAFGSAVYALHDNSATTTTLINCLFTGNRATANTRGGVVHFNQQGNGDGITLINCTFTADNTANAVGNIFYYDKGASGTAPQFLNCVIANADNGIDLFFSDNGATMSDVIFKNTLTNAATLGSNAANVNNIMGASDLGLNPSGTLAAGSPAIDMGDNSLHPNAATGADLAGNARVANGTIDIGAYEYNGAATCLVTVNSGTGGGNYAQGVAVTITADAAPSGQQFKGWTVVSGGVTLNNAQAQSTTFTMPANAVTVTATYEASPATTYLVTVNNGTGGGNYAQGATVSISAGTAPTGMRFKNWTASPAVTFADANSASTTFSMIDQAVTVTANFEAIPATVTGVTVNPSAKTLQPGDTFQFGATVQGTDNPDQGVTWSVTDGDGSSSIAPDGTLTVGAAETDGDTLTVTATSTADGSESDDAIVTISATPPPIPTVTSIDVTPAVITLNKGDTHTFSAVVNGMDDPPQGVIWTVEGAGGTTAITPGGVLTIAADETAATLTVKAASTFNAGVSGTATVTVTQPAPSFVAVSNIAGVPAAATAGTPLTLTGTVVPVSATNQTITWSVSPGNTLSGVSVSGTTLNTTTAGTAIVRATIANGTAVGTNFTQDFNITISAAAGSVYTITFDPGSGSVTLTSAQTDADGKLASLPTPTRSGSYSFDGWFTTSSGGTQITTSTVFTANATICAHWTYTGGNGGGITTTPTTPTTPDTGNNTITTPTGQPPVTDDQGNTILPGGGTVTTEGGAVIDAPPGTTIDADGNITIPPGKEADMTLPGGQEITLPGGSTIDDSGNITTGGNTQIDLPGGKTIDVPAGSTITGDGKLTIGTGGGSVSCGDGGVTLHIAAGTVVILDEEVPLGYFVSASNPFTDVKSGDWFYDNVMFVYTHGLFSGTSASTFSPGASMTRAMFVTVLARLAGVDTAGGETWYTQAVEWAKANGISDGTNPDSPITREQMAVMLWGYMKYKGIAIPTDAADAFADESKISTWALEAVKAIQSMGIVSGKPGNLYDPQATATRAEVATIFANLIKYLAK